MSKPFLAVSLSLLVLAGCQRSPEPANDAASPASEAPAPVVAEPAKPKPKVLTAEEIAAIEASGRTGLWSDVTDACAKGKPQSANLTWNVKAQHDGRVVVYLIDKNGEPRNFGQSGPVGSKQTGNWLRPGMIFRVRTQETKQDLAELTIGERADC